MQYIDIAWFVGFVVTGIVYLILVRTIRKPAAATAGVAERVDV